MSSRRGAWDRYRAAAVEGPSGERPAGPDVRAGRLRALASDWWSVDPAPPVAAAGRWRDLRLVPLGAAAWLGAAVGPFAVAPGLLAVLLACCLAGAAAAATLALALRRLAGRRSSPHRGACPTQAGAAGVAVLAA
ncbi:hypothetical protein [Sinomonas atrocyanea]|nr:hypothetical protein [Sinomonas atrocyanea]GGG82246.1 hypothetical protein GCM10007172_39760 [Sinomonas atrocyanea]